MPLMLNKKTNIEVCNNKKSYNFNELVNKKKSDSVNPAISNLKKYKFLDL